MEQITSHVVNPANDLIKLVVVDAPGSGNACHHYRIFAEGDGADFEQVDLHFQNGIVTETGVNGITHEVLLAVLEHRLQGFQSGPFACEENAKALAAIQEAQSVLQERTKKRMARGVEGTHTI